MEQAQLQKVLALAGYMARRVRYTTPVRVGLRWENLD